MNEPSPQPGQPVEARGRGEWPEAVVIGLDSATGLQVARVLAERGVVVVGLADRLTHWACRTRVVDRVHLIPPAENGLLDVLGDPTMVRPGSVLFPCTDQSVLTIINGADNLRPLHRFSEPPAAAVTELLDKALFAKVAERNGIRTPTTVMIERGQEPESRRAALSALAPPWVVKPAIKDDRWLSEAPNKALRIDGPDRFEAVERALAWADSLLVQEWIDGPDGALVTCNCYVDPQGRPEVAVVSAKLRQWPPDVGTASSAVTIDDEAVADCTMRILTSTGFHGLGYVEYKRVGDELVAIEANVGRPTGRSVMAEAAGVDLHFALYADLAGIERDPLGSPRAGVTWVHLRRDLQAAVRGWRRGEVKPLAWIRSLRGPRVEAVGRLDDPAPFLYDVGSTVAKRLPSIATSRLGSGPGTDLTTGDLRVNSNTTDNVTDVTVTPEVGGEGAADFDLAGMVRVRVFGDEGQIELVGRQLGLSRTAPAGDPDLTVRFADDVGQHEPMRYLGRDEAGFTSTGFYQLRSKAKARALVDIPFDRIGDGLIVSCQPGLPAVPLLIPLLAVTALHRGLVPLHAGAIQWDGTGIVFTGWSKGGKTETLIATTAAGADYVGDEWCYIDPSRSTVVGIPEPVTLWSWHLRRFPTVREQVPVLDRQRMRLLEAPDRLERALPDRVQQSRVGRLLRRVAYQTRTRANAWIPPEQLFGVTEARAVPFNHVVWTVSTESEEVRLRSLPATEIADRMTHSVHYELSPLLEAYRMYRFAFPDRRSDLLDDLEDHLGRALHSALDGATGWVLEHPYELDLAELADALKPLVDGEVDS